MELLKLFCFLSAAHQEVNIAGSEAGTEDLLLPPESEHQFNPGQQSSPSQVPICSTV